MKNIVALCGSIRPHSSNYQLLKAIGVMMAGVADLQIIPSLAALPYFDPGLKEEETPASVLVFRQRLREAEGILICTPEYAHGVPGVLKNALDWTVTTSEFSHKPTALITASSDGRWGHRALLETLRVIEAENIDRMQLIIPFIRTKMDGDGKITDEGVRQDLQRLIDEMIRTIGSGPMAGDNAAEK